MALVITAALVPRAALQFRSPVLYVVGSRPYYATALQLVTGQEVDALSLRHTPGYPAFLVAVIGLFGIDPQAISLVQHLLGVVSAVLCFALGTLLAGRLVGLAAGLVTALDTTLVVYEQHILTETLFLTLLMAVLVLLVLGAQRRPGWLLVAAGLVIGLAALTRPIGQTLVLAAPPGFLVHYRNWRTASVASLLVAAGFLLTAGPWALRNTLTQAEVGVRHPGSTLLGTVMHERPYTRGFFTLDGGTDPDPLRNRARRIIERMAPDEPDPLEMWTQLQQELGVTPALANKLMGDVAIDTITRHPQHYAAVFVLNVWDLFALPRDEHYRDYVDRTEGRWPGRLLAPAVKSGAVPDLNPSKPTVAEQWEVDRAAAVADFFRPTRAAPLMAGLFTVAVVGALLRTDRRALLIPALAVLAIVVVNGVIAGDKPRYRYPLDPTIATIAIAGAAIVAETLAKPAFLRLARRRRWQVRAPAG
jgi:4-amino-4-deoxy-L-arabinose transferase-like glycosyltransferase